MASPLAVRSIRNTIALALPLSMIALALLSVLTESSVLLSAVFGSLAVASGLVVLGRAPRFEITSPSLKIILTSDQGESAPRAGNERALVTRRPRYGFVSDQGFDIEGDRYGTYQGIEDG